MKKNLTDQEYVWIPNKLVVANYNLTVSQQKIKILIDYLLSNNLYENINDNSEVEIEFTSNDFKAIPMNLRTAYKALDSLKSIPIEVKSVKIFIVKEFKRFKNSSFSNVTITKEYVKLFKFIKP